MKLFIVGLPGSGKSTLGKQLAERLALPFLDLDDLIEQQTGEAIRDTFAQRGEGVFRQIEQSVLREVIAGHDQFVLATGGGAPCFFDNMDLMNSSGITLFLDVSIPTIVQRMSGDQVSNRPLLQALDQDQLAQEYTAKFEKRLSVYRQAQVIVDQCDSLDDIMKDTTD